MHESLSKLFQSYSGMHVYKNSFQYIYYYTHTYSTEPLSENEQKLQKYSFCKQLLLNLKPYTVYRTYYSKPRFMQSISIHSSKYCWYQITVSDFLPS